MFNDVTAIVLAGGKSSRMGDDKSLLPVKGKPLIQHIISQLSGYFTEIIIGANNAELYSDTKLRVIPDELPNQGPLMGIYSCLKASSTEINFVTACDIPQININLIQQMLDLVANCQIVMPVSNSNRYEPLFAVYKKSVAASIAELLGKGNRKVTDLLRVTDVKFVDFSNQQWYSNLNTKDDYLTYLGME